MSEYCRVKIDSALEVRVEEQLCLLSCLAEGNRDGVVSFPARRGKSKVRLSGFFFFFGYGFNLETCLLNFMNKLCSELKYSVDH
jgi:hypothetical protein